MDQVTPHSETPHMHFSVRINKRIERRAHERSFNMMQLLFTQPSVYICTFDVKNVQRKWVKRSVFQVKLQNYIEKRKMRLIDFFNQFDADGSMSVTREEFSQGLEVSLPVAGGESHRGWR